MSRRPKVKASALPTGAPVSPTGEMPGLADSHLPESKGRPAGLSDRWTVLGICIFLAVITFVVFSQTLHHEFVNYDDELYVADNPAVLGGLSLKGIIWAFTHNVNVNWTPLTMITHMLDHQLYGTNAGGHHLTSVLLHLASVLVLFLVLKEMTGALWRSAFVAALFAIHPLHVESVAWIAERRDVLSGLFFMLTLGAYVRYVEKSKVQSPKSKVCYGLTLVFFALGLMSKPMVVTLPLVLLLLDYWPLKRFPQPGDRLIPWRLVAEKGPLLALSGAVCVATLFAQKEAIQSVPLAMRIGNALVSYVAYLGQMIYPVGLAVFYPYPGNGLALWKVISAFVLLLVISAGVVAARRKQPWFLVGWLWYLGMLVPAIGLIQSGLRARADRYTYLPQVGLYLLLAWAAVELCAGWRHRRAVLGGCAMIILAALIFCARVQTSYWRNSELLWTHTLACTSDNAEAHYNLGNALLKKGDVDEAIDHYQKALQISPNSADVHNNFGNALIKKDSVDKAIDHYQKALQINPTYAKAHLNLGSALLKKGSADEAITHFQKALQINPDYVNAHLNLGNALLKKGSVDEAITHYQKALQINPDNTEAQNNLAWVLATTVQAPLRNGRQAVELAQQANRLAGGENPIILRTLAAAYAEAGQYSDAQQSAQKAMAMARTAGQSNLVEQLNDELKLYAAGLPFHQESK
jgi:protein O-mannosyl-transferase